MRSSPWIDAGLVNTLRLGRKYMACFGRRISVEYPMSTLLSTIITEISVKWLISHLLFEYEAADERIEERPPKYELIGIHTGRRIFIVNTLSLGIPPNAVMKWTDTTTTSTRQCFRILISWTVD